MFSVKRIGHTGFAVECSFGLMPLLPITSFLLFHPQGGGALRAAHEFNCCSMLFFTTDVKSRKKRQKLRRKGFLRSAASELSQMLATKQHSNSCY